MVYKTNHVASTDAFNRSMTAMHILILMSSLNGKNSIKIKKDNTKPMVLQVSNSCNKDPLPIQQCQGTPQHVSFGPNYDLYTHG